MSIPRLSRRWCHYNSFGWFFFCCSNCLGKGLQVPGQGNRGAGQGILAVGDEREAPGLFGTGASGLSSAALTVEEQAPNLSL